LNCSFETVTMLNIVTWCPLIKGAKEIGPVPSRQFLRHLRRWSSLNSVPFEQHWEQLRILHGNQINLCPWNSIQWDELLMNLLSRLLTLFDLRLITRTLNNIGNGPDSGNRVRSQILLLT